ncbi:MAG: serine hydrolase domain-containing protein, partial [Actinomycetota bacterium]
MPRFAAVRRRAALLVTVIAVGTVGAVGAGCGGGDGEPTGPKALPAATVSRLQDALDTTRTRMGFPGVIAGVWTRDGSWTGVSGTAGPDGGGPPDPQAATRIGSVTKTFTVTLLLQLAADDRLSLDDPIGDWFPGIPNPTARLHDLAAMRSGIPDYAADPTFQREMLTKPTRTFTADELIAFARLHPADFAPGTRFAWSNTNTVLLARVVSEVAGKPFGALLEERILRPLGLDRTSYPGASADLPVPRWRGVTDQGRPSWQATDATEWNPSWAAEAGAMISTLDDLRTWTVALATGEGVLDAEAQAARLDSLAEVRSAPRMSYGLGLRSLSGWLGHTGEFPGYGAEIGYDPETGTTVVVLTNSDVAG